MMRLRCIKLKNGMYRAVLSKGDYSLMVEHWHERTALRMVLHGLEWLRDLSIESKRKEGVA